MLLKVKQKIQAMLAEEKAAFNSYKENVTVDYNAVVAEQNIKCLQQVLKIQEFNDA